MTDYNGDSLSRMTPSRTHAPLTIAVSGLAALAVAMGIGRFAFTPILPMMQEDVGLSLADGGRLAAANYVGFLVGALWAMVQPARTDHAVRASLAITAAATLAMAFADGMLAYLALRALAGVGSAWGRIHRGAGGAGRGAALRRPGVRGGGGGRKVRRKWPRRRDHKAPKPPKLRVLSKRLKARINRHFLAK